MAGTNLDKLKKHLENKNRGKFFWRPREDKQKFRIIPNPNEEELFYVELGYHKLGDSFFNCPNYAKEKSGSCPVCDKVRKLYKGGEEDKELAGEIKATRQYLYNGIVRGEDYLVENGEESSTPDVKIIQVGKQIHDKIINAVLSDDIGDITDTEKGFDVICNKGQNGRWPDWKNSEISRKASPLMDSKEAVDYCLEHYKDGHEFIKYPNIEDIQTALDEYLSEGVVTTKLGFNDPKNSSKESSDSSSADEDFPEDEDSKEEEAKAELKEEPKKEEPKKEEAKKESSDFDQWEKEFESDFA